MSEEAEAMANALRDTVEKLASTGSSLSLIEWSEASNRILHAASLIRSQAERIRVLEADAARWRDLEEGREVYVRGIRMHLPLPREYWGDF